ncbi:hypothetical protein [Cryobacterium sp. PH29-G1]|uniref:hypothetical protein n=1 Tax=Cryobacterium sp. PH29-G1 TaxID=3046211 RepID=UPI0024B8D8AC|nr:hypothetical protein [Cryobacterium sp. PH29-G1]MDJ0350961.1 hypothetical protein [Cryobacterium sp. PH29-G1]
MKIKRLLGMVLAASLATALLVAMAPSSQAEAANASSFDPGNIISDAVFFNGNAMTADSVQQFLNAKVPTCSSGYVCLKSYTQDTPNRAEVFGRCAAYSGRAGESAASIISRVGIACGISQQALIVLLEKEQGIVSDSTPSARQYRSATGYGCPDTADCDTSYYGFFNQVYAAALQFQYYAANPTRWSHVPGRVNAVRFHPNSSCGSGSVYIQNQATAGLYNYTPYQPNAAALANLYGSGDACSSYGNRNFFRIFSDWFGDPQRGTSLVRSVDNVTVYLISGTQKHAIPDWNTLNALYPLGAIGYVSQQYLDNFTTGAGLGRVIRSSAGKVYFFDVGAKLQFMTCDDVSAYGYPCGDSILLTDQQISSLRDGPAMSRVFNTTDHKRFLIEAGARREVLDDASLAAVPHPENSVTLFEPAIAYLPYGTPVARNGVAAETRGSNALGLLVANRITPITEPMLVQSPLRLTFSTGSLDSESIVKLNPSAGITGFMKDADKRLSVMTTEGRIEVAAATYAGIPFLETDATVLANLPVKAKTTGPHFVKEASSSSLYLIADGKKQRLLSWAPYGLYVQDHGVPATIWTVPDGVLTSIPEGAALAGLASGQLVKSASSPRIYLVDGSRLLALSTFGVSVGLGFGGAYSVVSDATIASYDATTWIDSLGVKCGPDFLAGIGGKAAPIYDPTLVKAFGLKFVQLSTSTCAAMPKTSTPMTYFIRGETGKIYWIDGGQKRPINTWSEIERLGAMNKWIDVSGDLLDAIPTGASTAPGT